MDKTKLFISTIAADAHAAAVKYGVNLEIAEYCTAWNMDEEFSAADPLVRQKLEGVERVIFHAPFNELFPCAIDKKARALAAERYRQATALAKHYGAEKVVIHGGYNPWIYYPVWYVEQSIGFWRDYLKEDPVVELVLENVLETDPQWLLDIVRGVDDQRLRLCLDVGHVNAYSKIPIREWVDAWQPYLSHFHIHNNDGSWDTHSALNCGSIPIRELLAYVRERCPDATFTLELMEAEPSLRWLLEE